MRGANILNLPNHFFSFPNLRLRHCTNWPALQLSCENEHEAEGLLLDCRAGVRERAKTIQVECVGSMHGNLLS